MTDIPPIQFAPARSARLAYQVFGDGPVTMVAIPPTAQNIEVAWERAEVRRMFDRFASFSRFLHFDKRGTGASDRRSRVQDIDERVDDLRAVMDHAGISRAHLFAASEGGPMAILFAATYPDRAESLTLFGSGASMMPQNLNPEERADELERQRRYAAVWGTPDSPVVDGFAPSLAADQSFRSWHQRYERAAASRDSLRDLLELTLDMDVREVLPFLDLPVLILHRTEDLIVPVEYARELAAAIPGAKLVELEGADHFGYAGDLEAWMVELERFVTGAVQPRPAMPNLHPAVRIETMGRFAVFVEDEVPVSAWGSRRARQLLKRLVTARGWPVTRDHLCDILWPDEGDRGRLSARLSVQLSAVRRVLGGGVIASREAIQLDLAAVDSDLERFHAAEDDAAVVAAYGGEFLPEDVYEDWTGPVRDEARARFVSAARRLASHHLDHSRYQLAAEVARRLIVIDRYDEAAHRLLVEVLLAAGEQGEAQRAHATWRAAMAELDIEIAPFDS
ncbi:MAG: alpha/beta fold hydrolase [Acidimicrobiia bacterium]|nr:alpha/beta fold hydrolase [Acidimicrobiia bacterium]